MKIAAPRLILFIGRGASKRKLYGTRMYRVRIFRISAETRLEIARRLCYTVRAREGEHASACVSELMKLYRELNEEV